MAERELFYHTYDVYPQDGGGNTEDIVLISDIIVTSAVMTGSKTDCGTGAKILWQSETVWLSP